MKNCFSGTLAECLAHFVRTSDINKMSKTAHNVDFLMFRNHVAKALGIDEQTAREWFDPDNTDQDFAGLKALRLSLFLELAGYQIRERGVLTPGQILLANICALDLVPISEITSMLGVQEKAIRLWRRSRMSEKVNRTRSFGRLEEILAAYKESVEEGKRRYAATLEMFWKPEEKAFAPDLGGPTPSVPKQKRESEDPIVLLADQIKTLAVSAEKFVDGSSADDRAKLRKILSDAGAPEALMRAGTALNRLCSETAFRSGNARKGG